MNDKKINTMDLPNDVKKLVNIRILKRIVPCAVLVVICALFLVFFGDRIFNTDVIEFKISCYILVMLVPFLITGVPYKLLDKSYCGTVERVDVVSGIGFKSSVNLKREMLYHKNIVLLTIKTDEGKILQKKVREEDVQNVKNLQAFREGDVVFHLLGSDHTVIISRGGSDKIGCAVCGSLNNIDDEKCHYCGYTVVKKQSKK